MTELDLPALAARHDLPVDALEALLLALRRGGGRQAQFSHPALGGMGQWSRGGGIMIGDMFDHDLKAKVARACDDLAELVGEGSSGQTSSGQESGSQASGRDWWPSGLGRPSAVGRQNAQGYAFFPEARRLAIRDHDGVRLYDTKDHRVTGVSQQQSNGSGTPSFRSQHGEIRLDELAPVAAERAPPAEGRASQGETDPKPSRHVERHGSHEVLATIERLHELHRKGVLTDAEFADKKTDLLARL